MAESTTITLSDVELFKQKALHWANNFRTVCLLDSNNYPHKKYRSKDWLLAIDAVSEINGGENAFDELAKFRGNTDADIFGFFYYDLKNQIEKLSSSNHDGIQFPELYFFKPRYVFEITGDKLTVNRNYPETFEFVELITNYELQITNYKVTAPPQLKAKNKKEKYLKNVKSIKKQI